MVDEFLTVFEKKVKKMNEFWDVKVTIFHQNRWKSRKTRRETLKNSNSKSFEAFFNLIADSESWECLLSRGWELFFVKVIRKPWKIDLLFLYLEENFPHRPPLDEASVPGFEIHKIFATWKNTSDPIPCPHVFFLAKSFNLNEFKRFELGAGDVRLVRIWSLMSAV